MNDGTLLRTGYARPEGPVRTARALEYDLFARTTGRIARAWDRRAENFAELAAALHANVGLWSILAADVADPGNALPAPLRAQIFYLYEFTALHSRRVLADGATVAALIDVNTAVMRGLRGDGGAA